MQAALKVFAERGFAATRLDEVAQRAGVSKGTVYLYFESKEALFKAAVEAAVRPTLEAGEAIASGAHQSASAALSEFVWRWWEQVGTSDVGALPKILIAEIGNFPELGAWFHENLIQRAKRAVSVIVSRGIASGEFRPVDPVLAAHAIFGQMFSYILWRRALVGTIPDLPDPDVYFTTTLDFFINGLKDKKT